jgi:hypothetical protein
MSFEEGNPLFQSLDVVHDAMAGIALTAYPATKGSSLMTMVEMEIRGRAAATLTKTVSRPRWALLGRGRTAIRRPYEPVSAGADL